jgi:Secretion system C-terminal sorting domain
MNKKNSTQKTLLSLFVLLGLFVGITFFLVSKNHTTVNTESMAEEQENEEYDGPDKAASLYFEQTKDPRTGKIPMDEYYKAMMETNAMRKNADFMHTNALLSWTERGPYIDAPGPAGNSRPPNTSTGGRIRTILVDSLDPTHKTVWVGSVGGGMWKTTDITTSPANWTIVNDFLSNLAIADMCQDPTNGNIMYAATGESYFNADAISGVGVFKSTDHGVTWTLLASTTTFTSCTRILCDFQGNIYLGTRDNGLLRSTNGGTSWTTITPTGLGTSRICDLELSSTAGPARLHVVSGIFSSQGYRFTDNPSTVASGTWTTPTTTFVTAVTQRAEITVRGNVLYALPANNSYQVPAIYKSTDGGDNWFITTTQPTSGWASAQGWYALTASINPANVNECIIGGLDLFRTTDGGITWNKISSWVGSTVNYVHADQHDIAWYDAGTKLIFACDGGIHYSTNGGTNMTDRNIGLRIKQFYSVAMHPTTTNYFIAGAQDNGTHQLTQPGLGASTEITGGDGAYVDIDQDQPQYQFGAYVYNQYRRSTDGGTTWTGVNFSGSVGQFINPFDYDDVGNRLYACYAGGQYLRWNNPQTGNTTSIITIPSFSGAQVGSVQTSPYTANRVYFGTITGRIVQVDNADQATPTDINITGASMPASSYVNCVNVGSNDQNLVACFSNFGVMNVWVSTNGGTSWTGIDGNLPNMPVNWAIFHPDDNTKMFLGTEAGVWETDLINGASTVWAPNTSFPNTRVTMLKYRPSDRTVAASTHGRGVWSALIPSACQPPTLTAQPTSVSACTGSSVSFTVAATIPTVTYQWQVSTNGGGTFSNIGAATAATYTFTSALVQNNNQYRCIVTTICTPLQSTTSNAAVLTVANGISIITQPSSSTVCSSTNTSFTVSTSGVPSSYKWQISTNGGASYTDLVDVLPYSGVGLPTLNVNNPTGTLNGNLYRCVLASGCGNLTTNGASLTVNPNVTISSNPVDQSICLGNTASFAAAASGIGLGYQWQVSTNGGGTYSNIGGATASNYSFTPVAGDNNKLFRCVITSGCGGPLNTTGALLTVNGALVITGQPTSLAVCAGLNANFSVAVTGVVNNYQWQVSTNGGASFSNITNGGLYAGATTANLSLTGVTASLTANQYRCVVTGSCPSINSSAATLTVYTAPSITTPPVASSNICATQNTSFTIAATGTAIGYQWQVSTNGGISFSDLSNGGNYAGVTTTTLAISNVTIAMNTYQYRCVVTGTCSPAATSSVAVLGVYIPVAVGLQPVNTTICSTGTTSFTVTATGTSPTYQWEVSTNNGLTFTDISGATATTLTLTNVSLSMQSNQYRCRVIGLAPCGFVTSTPATLTVSAQPTVSLNAAPYLNVFPGLTTILTATTSLNPSNVTYTWFKNTTPFTNATNTYPVTVNNLGTYRVTVVDNTNGCTNTSNSLTIGDSASSKLFIYPSPNDGRFTVSYFNSNLSLAAQTISIFDAAGSLVYSQRLPVVQGYQLHQMDLRRNKSGIYHIIIGDANGKKLASGEVLVNK